MQNDAGVTAKSNHCWDEAPFVLSSARSGVARRREELIPAKQNRSCFCSGKGKSNGTETCFHIVLKTVNSSGSRWNWLQSTNLNNNQKSLGSPRGAFRPVRQDLGGPCGGLVFVTRGTRIRDVVSVGHGWSDEGERVGADFYVGDGGLNFWHVASDAFASSGAGFVMSVLLDGQRARAIQRHRSVAVQADLVGRLAELCVVVGAVDIVAGETSYASAIHHALHEIVALHAIFMGGAVGVVSKGRSA